MRYEQATELLDRGQNEDLELHIASRDMGSTEHSLGEHANSAGCYPPVESAVRVLEVLRAVSRLKTASVSDLHKATGQNKSTIVRMLQTLIDTGYVVSDKLCGGYRTTSKVRDLVSGYDTSSRIIEAVRPHAINLTERFNWLVCLGFFDGEGISKQLYTGSLSPWSHSNGVIRRRPKLSVTAMGRAYLAFCPPEELEYLLSKMRESGETTEADEPGLRQTLEYTRRRGYSIRDPKTEPQRMTTIAMPIREDGEVVAVISCSFFKSVIDNNEIVMRAVKPLSEAISRIEAAIATSGPASLHG
jgi:IclR family mhp operon transcriptional activator